MISHKQLPSSDAVFVSLAAEPSAVAFISVDIFSALKLPDSMMSQLPNQLGSTSSDQFSFIKMEEYTYEYRAHCFEEQF